MINNKSMLSTSALLATGMAENTQAPGPAVPARPASEGTAAASGNIQTESTNLNSETGSSQKAVGTAERDPSKKSNALSAKSGPQVESQTAKAAGDSRYSEDSAIPEINVPPKAGLEPVKTVDDNGIQQPDVQVRQPAKVPNPEKQESMNEFSKQGAEATPPETEELNAPLRTPSTPSPKAAAPTPDVKTPEPQRPRVRQKFHQPPVAQVPQVGQGPRPNMPNQKMPTFKKPSMPKMPGRPRGL